MTTTAMTTASPTKDLETARPSLMRPVSPDQLLAAHGETAALIKKALVEGTDYGTIPGAGDKKALFKAGAESISIAFGCRPRFTVVEQTVEHDAVIEWSAVKWVTKPKPQDWERLKASGHGRNKKWGERWDWQEREDERGTSLGLYRYVVKCELMHDGAVVGEGMGVCSTLETKYIRSPRDAENTVLKMAKKRALVDVVLTTFGLSDRFTQDVEDDQEVDVEQVPPPDTAALVSGIGAELDRLGLRDKTKRNAEYVGVLGRSPKSPEDLRTVLDALRARAAPTSSAPASTPAQPEIPGMPEAPLPEPEDR
jgi:hypothetical protein